MFVESGSRLKRQNNETSLGLRLTGWRLIGMPSLGANVSASLLLALCLAGVGIAQNTNSGDIRGTVTDATGAAIPGATVTLLNTDTGVVKELVTNSSGLYDAVSILPGQYTITFSKEGFEKQARTGIKLEVGEIRVDSQLGVGSNQQQIEVTAEAPLLKTENAEQSTTLEAATMEQLPNVGQSWENFLKLLPGSSGTPASNAGAVSPGVGLSINGTLPYYTNFLVDGASIRLPHSANIDDAAQISETESEVQVNTSTFSAQYGGGGAIFNVITKSGANQWHGTAYFLRLAFACITTSYPCPNSTAI